MTLAHLQFAVSAETDIVNSPNVLPMSQLSISQLRLLRFMQMTPGPSFRELSWFAVAIGSTREKLLPDLVKLLQSLLIYPSGAIEAQSGRPAMFQLTDKGIREAAAGQPFSESEEEAWLHLSIAEESDSGEGRGWPAFAEWPSGELDGLLVSYIEWSKRRPSEFPGIEPHEISRATVEGYYHIRNAARFREALLSWIETKEGTGTYDFLLDVYKMSRFDGGFGNELCARVAPQIATLRWEIFEELLPPPTTGEALREQVEAILTELERVAHHYQLQPPDPETLEISNRIEDLMALAFRLRSRDLYGQSVLVLVGYLEIYRSMLKPNANAAEFDRRTGYTEGVETAVTACGYLELFSRAVDLPSEPAVEAASQIRSLMRLAVTMCVTPVRRLLRMQNHPAWAYWASTLIDRSAIRGKLLEHFELLRSILLANHEPAAPVPATLIISKTELDGLVRAAQSAEGKIESLTLLVAELLNRASRNDEALANIGAVVSSSRDLLAGLDARLSAHDTEIRNQVRQLREEVDGVKGANVDEKAALLAKIDEYLKEKSTGKIVVELPIIPLLVKYKAEFGIRFDTKRWLSTLF